MDMQRRIAEAGQEMAALASQMSRLRIVSMDLEYGDRQEGFVELGIATWDRGARSGRQILVGSEAESGSYLHGSCERMSLEDACAALDDAMKGADAIAGHDLSGDRLRLKRLGVILPHVPVYDTARMSKRLFTPPFQAQLRAMLQIYGIPADGIHVAGNDAWAVLDLLLEMARQGPAPCAGPDGGYRHPSERSDILRDRHTANGYVVEPGGRRRSATGS